jgi:metalloendopeptidase OMA1, mitochondrial
VLGHEISHAIARHGGERMSQQLAVQGISLTAAETLLAGRDPAIVQLASAALGGIASVGVLLPFSRAQESEADHLGMVYMAKAGYDPHAARDLWTRMASANTNRPIELLSTHPLPETRIAQIEGWIPEAMTYYKPR